jgi:hypothetical protein
MSEAANKQLARRWFEEVWNQGRESTIDELFHPEGKAYGFPEPDSVLVGPENFKAIHRAFHNIYGDIHIDIDDLIAEGDRVAIRWTCTMTHTGTASAFPQPEKRPLSPAHPSFTATTAS